MAQSSGTVKRCTPCSQARKLLPAAVRKRLERLEDKMNARKAAKRLTAPYAAISEVKARVEKRMEYVNTVLAKDDDASR